MHDHGSKVIAFNDPIKNRLGILIPGPDHSLQEIIEKDTFGGEYVILNREDLPDYAFRDKWALVGGKVVIAR